MISDSDLQSIQRFGSDFVSVAAGLSVMVSQYGSLLWKGIAVQRTDGAERCAEFVE